MAQRKAKKPAKARRKSAWLLEEPQARRAQPRPSVENDDQFPIVAVGASAGGLKALEAFFRPFPAKTGMCFVVVTHLDPRRESLLPSILSRWTALPVVQASDGNRVVPDKVFVIGPNAVMTISDGRLRIRKRRSVVERPPLDIFFSSLAEDQAERAVAIVLSGSGSDGALGIKAVKGAGGLTLAQGGDGSQAQFKEMPEAAAATGLVDLVLPVEDMASRLLAYARGDQLKELLETKSAHDEADLRPIYTLVRARVGHDFSRYKERTFLRRVQRRMQVLQLTRLEDYVERLQRDSNEATLLFRDLLIGVTNFFRDREAFAALEKFVPRLFEGKGADDTVRVWVPGCATGEEAYSIAILLHEYADRLTSGAPKIQIFASDIDENALAIARNARYPAILLRDIPSARLNRFFVREGTTYHVVKELRDLCVFSAHSLIRDPPFSRLDLISCRNLLIYLSADLQAQIIPLFHYALRGNGILFLGTSENVSRHADLFAPLDKKWRIFERQILVSRSVVAFPTAAGGQPELNRLLPSRVAHEANSALATLLRRIAAIVTENFAPAYVVVNKEGEVVYYSNRTGRYLEPAEGPPNRDLVTIARKGLRLDLRAALHRARETGVTATIENIPVQINGGSQLIRLTVVPVSEGGETLYIVLFSDLAPETHDDKPSKPPDETKDSAIQQLERELQTTKERLQSMSEEFATSSEELKSSNEELLSVNEELQSANEELETSKEEIQSINEELQTVNAELGSKVEDLDRANADLKNLFESTQVATIILDNDLLIRSFTPAVESIFNLIPSDRGRPLIDIASRLDEAAQDFHRELRGAIDCGQAVERRVTAQGGNLHYLMRILPYRMFDKQVHGALITFDDITNVIRAEEHEKILTSELNHRVRTVLGSVMSITTNTLKRSKTLKDFSDDISERFHALARTHEAVTKTGWFGTPLAKLVAAEVAPYVGQSLRKAQIRGPNVILAPKAALALGMAIYELAANAARQGALTASRGRIDVEWRFHGGRPARMLELSWSEKGGPPVAAGKPRSGVDLAYVERGMHFELGGTTELELRRSGLRCTIRIPAAGNVARGDNAPAG